MEAQLERPKFRTDLVAQPLEENGQLVVEVIDPDSGGSFRFYEVEYYIASAMNGERSVSGLRDWALNELGVSPEETELGQLVRTLADLGYLSSAATSAVAAAAPAPAPHGVELGFAGGTPPPMAAPIAAPMAAPMAAPIAASAAAGAAADLEDVALGLSGVAGDAAAEVADGALDDSSFDLGMAGKSDMTVERAKAPAAPAVELGMPGKAAPAPVPVAPPAAASAASELSFAGLMDDAPAAPVTPVTPATPAAMTGPLGGKQPLPADFGNLDGITPPPADVPVASLRPVTNVDLDEDGPTNLPPAIPIGGTDDDDVSVDLSAHLDLGVDDLKEAVRQSKVMNAVEIPADLLAELDGGAPEVPVATAAAAATPQVPAAAEPIAIAAKAPEVEAKSTADKPATPKSKVLSKSELKAKETGKSATFPLPEPPTSVKPVEPPQDKPEFQQGSSLKWLVAVLFVVLLAAGGYYYKTQILDKKKDDAKPATLKPGKQPATTVKPGQLAKPGTTPGTGTATKAPTPPPVAGFSRVEASSESVTMPKAAVLASVADDGADVAQGDIVATLAGAKRIQKKITSITNRRDRHYAKKLADAQKRLETATGANNAAQIRTWTKKVKQYEDKVAEKTAALAVVTAKLDALAIKAPVAGKVKRVAKPKAWVAKGKTVVEIAGVGTAFAAFSGPLHKSYNTGDKVVVHAEKDASKKATCTVRDSAANKVTVDCPTDAPFKAGDRTTLE